MKTPLHILQKINANRVRKDKILDLRNQHLLEVPPEVLALEHLEELWLRNNAIQQIFDDLNNLRKLRIVDLRINPLHRVGNVRGLVLDWGTYRRLAPQPQQIAGLWLLWTDDSLLHELLQLPNLRWLDLSFNRLGRIPEGIFQLQKLTSLELAGNELSTLPEGLFQLQNLASLYLTSNRLSALPDGLFELQNLTSLYLGNNRLSTLPDGLFELHNLNFLDLGFNELSTLPDGLFELKNLTSLNLGRNGLAGLPDRLFELKDLTSLGLWSNRLSALPDSLFGLQKLAWLDLASNDLRRFPEGLFKLQNLTSLNLGANGLSTLPDALFELQNLTSLYLGNNQLSTLPNGLFRLQNLTSLDLGGNGLSTLPDALFELQNLCSLYLGGNGLSTVPEGLFELQNLTSLHLGNNDLNTLPEGLFKLQNLCSLGLMNNGLSALPDPLSHLKNLTSLHLGSNDLNTLPDGLFELQNLCSLGLMNNGLSALPDGLFQLKNLTSLNLANNELRKLPVSLFELQNLAILNLEKNKLTEIPEQILNLRNLRFLYLRENPLENPPLETLEIRERLNLANLLKLHSWFRQQSEQGSEKIFEAKLLIVGEGGAGKTSLARKLLDRDAALPKETESTEGIDVRRWDFELEQGQNFRANIWDFGGQEIYHATHQFFLTKRSLYALVADTRRDDTDFYYWLNVVELLSDASPILIVKNEKDERLVELDEAKLRGRFGNLEKCFSTNLKTCRGLDALKDSMRHYLWHLPHVGSALPKTWVRVREALEADARNHITLGEYLELCEQHGFTRRDDKLQLSGYLHDLGVCLHFQNDDLLRKTVILKPEWGTEAVYKVLDNDRVKRAGGFFTKKDLAEIWRDERFLDMHGELLRLMMNFRLCYQLPAHGEYIAPQLLPKAQPSYHWQASDNLHLRYRYAFMPKGILGRLIVALHTAIEDQRRRVWRHGVVLAREHARAKVVEEPNEREIRIRIAGRNKRDLLTTLAYELDKIHEEFRRLQVEKLIPCSCAKCRGIELPHFYAWHTLKQFTADGQSHIQCQKSYTMVEVRGLLDDFIDETRLERLRAENSREAFGDDEPVKPIVHVQINNHPASVPNPIEPAQEKDMDKHKIIQGYLAFFLGVAFVLMIVLIALFIPNPTPFQYTVFRIVLALFAAGVAGFIPGVLHVKIGNFLRAGGALAVFAVVYFYSPAALVTDANAKMPELGGEVKLIE